MPRILVIDDDKSICTAIETFLRHQECTAVLADSGLLGTKIFDASEFDVVMVDIFMPGMDGLETIKGFRQRAPRVPIVAMSGFRLGGSLGPTSDFLGMAAKLGAAYCLKKPFGPQQLLVALNACLGGGFPSRYSAQSR